MTRHKKYIIRLSSLLAAVCLLAGGIGVAAAEDLQGEISFVTHRGDLVTSGYFDEMVSQFVKKHPDASVKVESLSGYHGNMRLRIQSGNMPDVFLIPRGIAKKYYPKYFEPLDDLGLNGKVRLENYYRYDGKTYGYSSAVKAEGIVYSKIAFEQAGITKVPTTLDEMFAALQKLKNAGITPFPTNMGEIWPLQNWDVLPAMIAGDSAWHESMLEMDAPYAAETPYGKALAIFKKIVAEGYAEADLIDTDFSMTKVNLGNGSAGMAFYGSWIIPQIVAVGGKPEDIGFFPFPYDNSDTHAMLLSDDKGYAVSASSKEKDLAKAFVKFLLTETDYAESNYMMPAPTERSDEFLFLQHMDPSVKYEFLEAHNLSDEWYDVSREAMIDYYGSKYISELVMSDDYAASIDKLNAAWKEAREFIGN